MATIAIVSLKGGVGKTTTSWNLSLYFRKHHKSLGFSDFNLIDLDYEQSNMLLWNAKREKNKQLNVFTVKNKKEFIEVYEEKLENPSMLNIIDTGGYASEINYLSYMSSDILILLLNPREEIEYRSTFATLAKIDKIYTDNEINAPKIKILFTKVHHGAKFETYSEERRFMEDYPFKKIRPMAYEAMVFSSRLYTIENQRGGGIWDIDAIPENNKTLLETKMLIKLLTIDIKEVK